MSKLTRAARLRSCSVRLPGCKNATETVVFAHAPSIDKGLGIKSPDWWGAFACSHCHQILDGQARGMINELALWLPAIYETQKIFFDEGYLLEG